MSWGEAKWIKEGVVERLEDMEKRYLVGSQREMGIPHGTRMYPDVVYGLSDKGKNYTDSNGNGSFKVYRSSVTREELHAEGIFPISIASVKNGMKDLPDGKDTLLHKIEFEDMGESFETEGLKYMLCASGTLDYTNAKCGITVELRENVSGMTVAIRKGTSMPYQRQGTVELANEIQDLEVCPKTVELYANAQIYNNTLTRVSNINAKYLVAGYKEDAVIDSTAIKKAFSYLEVPETAQGSLELNMKLQGIPGNQDRYNLFDGENYWFCDTLDMKTGKVIQRLGTKSTYVSSGAVQVTLSLTNVDENCLGLIRLYAVDTDGNVRGCSLETKPQIKAVLEGESFRGYIYAIYPLKTYTYKESNYKSTENLNNTFWPGAYNVQSNLIFPYMQALTDKGEFELQSFLCASENIDKLKHTLTGKTPLAEEAAFSEVVNCAEMKNLENKYVSFLNHTDVFGISAKEYSSVYDEANFIEGSVQVRITWDSDTKKMNVCSYLSGSETPVTTLNIGTETDTLMYMVYLYRVTDSSGYIRYYGHRRDTWYAQDRYIRPFKVDAAGKLTFGTAMKLLPADTDTTRYEVEEIPSLYDPYGVCFLIRKGNYTKYTYNGETYYDQASVTTTMRTVYFRPNDSTYTNLNSNADTTLGTSYEGFYVNGTDQSIGKTSVVIETLATARYSLQMEEGNIRRRIVERPQMPFFLRRDMVRNSAGDLTKETDYIYANQGAWREAPESYNYQTVTVNTSTGDITHTVQKPMTIPWRDQQYIRELLRIIRNGEGIYFVFWRNDGLSKNYVEDWYDKYIEIWEYCQVTHSFHNTGRKLSEFV